MVRPAVVTLKIDLNPGLQGNGPSSPQSAMVSPRLCKAFRHSAGTSRLASPKPFDTALYSDLKWSWCSTPLGRPHPLSPCTSSTRRGASTQAATGEDVLVASVPNFYDVLGLPQDVALPDIKAAYRLMARQHHPDVCPKEEAEESTRRFIAVQEAYETLSDPSRRAYYDRSFSLSFGSSGLVAKWGWDFDKESVCRR
ncbi:hypothetical protein O6H91_01G047600 [Diphasiastrum complanatum]|uniref:Uncharacterized protein n=1 Tax=Diphasiastrum complanatum TaxID=34168 RepID=A0ACC2EQM2_DIPCM|nr:hypothetical protein O6H91_01G047600 [Diphasiastrum complanatum]